MDVKEKLVELICRFCSGLTVSDITPPYGYENLADYLISNGVTVQEWIPVEDGLPDLIHCNAGTAYSEAVNVLTSGRKVITAIYNGACWIGPFGFWEADDEEITHWTHVLLPLPEPPKEDAK